MSFRLDGPARERLRAGLFVFLLVGTEDRTAGGRIAARRFPKRCLLFLINMIYLATVFAALAASVITLLFGQVGD